MSPSAKITSKKGRGLGRGLNSLIGEDVLAVASAPKTQVENSQQVVMLPIVEIQAGQYQPRQIMNDDGLKELADSIREQGVISPIIVRRLKTDRYEIIAGERRFRASQLAECKEIPCLIREVDNKTALAMALIENIQREDLNAIEEAKGVQRLIQEFGFTHEEAARSVGRSRSAITNLLRLLNLTDVVQQYLMEGKLEMGHARALLAVNGAQQVEIADEIIVRGLSVRQTEALLQKITIKKSQINDKKKTKISRDDEILNERLSESLGAPVHVVYSKKGKGQIIIDFADLDDLDALIAKFGLQKEG